MIYIYCLSAYLTGPAPSPFYVNKSSMFFNLTVQLILTCLATALMARNKISEEAGKYVALKRENRKNKEFIYEGMEVTRKARETETC